MKNYLIKQESENRTDTIKICNLNINNIRNMLAVLKSNLNEVQVQISNASNLSSPKQLDRLKRQEDFLRLYITEKKSLLLKFQNELRLFEEGLKELDYK
jgi:hypothetical protein